MTTPARLFVQQDMTRGELCSLAQGTAAVFSARCPEKQTANEDAAALIPFDSTSGVLAVADGLGGAPAGEQASRLALEKIAESVEKARHDGIELRDAILDGIENANAAVAALANGSATTLAAVEIQNRSIRPYHVGDSVILLVGQRGKIKLQTISHSPVGYAVEAGFLGEEEALHHEDRHVVSNFIGAPDMRIEIGPTVQMAARDSLLVASDGLLDNLHVDEVVERIRKGPLQKVAGTVARDSIHRMADATPEHPSKPDDLTFIVYRGAG